MRQRDRDRDGDRASPRRQAGPAIEAPQLLVPALAPATEGPAHVTTGVAEDLHEAARGATRAMIERLSGLGLSPEEAYALLSVAGDLRIHEIVNAPRWVVGMTLPDAVLA